MEKRLLQGAPAVAALDPRTILKSDKIPSTLQQV
jgi:hypothetical protein